MTRTAPAARLSGPGELAAALPLLCGFVPHESVVVVCVDRAGRLGLTMRIDLPPDAQQRAVAADLAARVRQADSRRAWVVVLSEQPDRPQEALVLALRDEVDVVDALLVRSGRWRSYLCDDPTCCPPTGTPVPRTSRALRQVEAASVFRGRAVLPSREDLVASVGPPPEESRVRFAAATAALAREHRDLGGASVRSRQRSDLQAALDEHPVDGASLALALHDVRLRDELLAWSLTREDEVLSLLLFLARTTPPPHDAPVCAALAWVAYARGDGALASVALGRALATDPAHGLARLLRQALDGQVSPRELRAAASLAAEDLRG